jgi:hypothetical protein
MLAGGGAQIAQGHVGVVLAHGQRLPGVTTMPTAGGNS